MTRQGDFHGSPTGNIAGTGNVDDSPEKVAPMTFNWLPVI